jgi:hypothetical protein
VLGRFSHRRAYCRVDEKEFVDLVTIECVRNADQDFEVSRKILFCYLAVVHESVSRRKSSDVTHTRCHSKRISLGMLPHPSAPSEPAITACAPPEMPRVKPIDRAISRFCEQCVLTKPLTSRSFRWIGSSDNDNGIRSRPMKLNDHSRQGWLPLTQLLDGARESSLRDRHHVPDHSIAALLLCLVYLPG